jgi:hypothetical protein
VDEEVDTGVVVVNTTLSRSTTHKPLERLKHTDDEVTMNIERVK